MDTLETDKMPGVRNYRSLISVGAQSLRCINGDGAYCRRPAPLQELSVCQNDARTSIAINIHVG
jgi:hypothetical protein